MCICSFLTSTQHTASRVRFRVRTPSSACAHCSSITLITAAACAGSSSTTAGSSRAPPGAAARHATASACGRSAGWPRNVASSAPCRVLYVRTMRRKRTSPQRQPMSSAEFGWQSLLHTDAPSACKLQAALFTTYDRADERLLAEHLLPLLLKLGYEPESEGKERQYFLVALYERLKKLHDRLVVV